MYFVSKLTPELKKVTGLTELKDLEEAIKFARNFDAWCPSGKNWEINQTSKETRFINKKNKANLLCTFCKRTGHTLDKCYSLRKSQNKTNNNNVKANEKMFFDYCKKTNHITDNCYKKLINNAKNEEKRKKIMLEIKKILSLTLSQI